mmetsp:Transcript_807/g.107  ORF Transcript_807/g.107 Transcript_807/m.107 type:complete len:80 (+) Transcript_807:1361-1600(+)
MLGEGIGGDLQDENESYNSKNIPDFPIDWFSYNCENPLGMVPSTINYYDNDDGYWDDWIRTKRERAGLPSITFREHFKH